MIIINAAVFFHKFSNGSVLVTIILHYATIRQEAAGALWNLSFDDRNREAIAAAGGVEALVRCSLSRA